MSYTERHRAHFTQTQEVSLINSNANILWQNGEKPKCKFGQPISQHNVDESSELIAPFRNICHPLIVPLGHSDRRKSTEESSFTFISKYSHSDGEESTQHIEQSYGRLQRPFILTLSALGALLDACVKRINSDLELRA